MQPGDIGRGRGFTTETTTTTTTISTSPGGTGSPHSSESPTESPPQQHSPTSQTAVGRAALRGSTHPLPGSGPRTDLIGEAARLTLQESDLQAAATAKREYGRIEAVIVTKPANCTTKMGTAGTPLKIICNYFEVKSRADFVLYQYHVDFAPVIDNKRMRIALFNDHSSKFPNNKAFDGGTLYTLTKLPDETTEWYSTRQSDKEQIRITLKRVCEIEPTSPQFVHLFNIVFRKCMTMCGMKQIEHNYYDMSKKMLIQSYNLELINGLATSIANYENQLLLCAELTHKVLHKKTVLQIMYEIYDNSRGNEDFREKAFIEIVGKTIMTTYNDKTYKIDDISWEENPRSTFSRGGKNPGQINYIDYYKTNYEKEIVDLEQPLLVVLPKERDKRRGQTDPIKLVPSLCVLTGLSDKMRSDFKFKKELEQFSKVGPSERVKRLSQFVTSFNHNPQVKAELGDKWRMNIGEAPAEIHSRVLPSEELAFGKNIVRKLNAKADWGNDMKATPLLNAVALKEWMVVFPQSKRQIASEFIRSFGKIIGGLGIPADAPIELAVERDDSARIATALKNEISQNKRLQMVVVILSSKNRKDVYDAVKRICCLELPVPSQVVCTPTIEDQRKHLAVVTKVAIQMNAKLGGELWGTSIPLKKTMICGIDTYHDSEKKNKSVCAFIATSNESKTRFFSRATIQETHQELSNNLTITVRSACEHYKKVNQFYPDKIIIYRDGVSDGQLKSVIEYEIPQIKKAFPLLEDNYDPGLAVVIVKKRGNARFFTMSSPEVGNVPCGTVVDTVVTRHEWFDFYLISQVVNQGTVNPTHYNVIHDSMGLKPDHFQRMSYKLTHLYYNWPGTIRVPALCQYAHKLAFLVGQSLHKEHDQSLSDKLFYL